jgi:hypothetical protein
MDHVVNLNERKWKSKLKKMLHYSAVNAQTEHQCRENGILFRFLKYHCKNDEIVCSRRILLLFSYEICSDFF